MSNSMQHNEGTNIGAPTYPARPAWSSPEFDEPARGGDQHPDDRGCWYESARVDTWAPAETDKAIEVFVQGFRHDNGDDWRDLVRASGTAPGFVGGVALELADARRLAKALEAACDLLEGLR
ncbi:hypothetical protein [Knoellia koreensis]|uniref:Uncharacterized protein n=1 Tax=Knoellia koreensis TaxID=2730921 RepID=A0A849HEG7_9MICO|nr:hypothetical protein [Knoellia sp. DB2414S]NNM44601.1 hypothetical protein [Knoellia sp. DB2414S]